MTQEQEPMSQEREPMRQEREPMRQERERLPQERERMAEERGRMAEGREPMPEDQEPMAQERQPSMAQSGGANGLGEYRARFEQLQAQFIDEPQSAVRSAQSLVKEAIDHLMQGMGAHQGGNDTEQLRLAMKRYRALIVSLTDEGAG